MTRLPAIAALLLLASPVLSQVSTSDRTGTVIGITGHPTSPLLLRMDMDTCKFGACSTALTPTKDIHGGSAWDARKQGIWVSTGKNLACIDPYTCRVICKEVAAPFAPLGATAKKPIVGGLAMDHRKNQLYMVDVANLGLHQVSIGSDCAFKARSCDISRNLPTGHLPGGLAIDNASRTLFVGSFHPTTGAVAVYATPLETGSTETWCRKRCNLVLSGDASFPGQCLGSSAQKPVRITGLAFESCRGLLYVTNGPWTTAIAWGGFSSSSLSCVVKPVKCCNYPSKVLNDQYIGLTVLPSRVSVSGRSCSDKACGSCPTIASAVGHPSPGNGDFAVRLSSAPRSAAPVILGIGIGPCVSPGVQLGGFCGPITVTPSPLLTFFVPFVPSSTQCGGYTQIPLPIPADHSACGTWFSAQFVMGCNPLGGGGSSVSNCVQFRVEG